MIGQLVFLGFTTKLHESGVSCHSRHQRCVPCHRCPLFAGGQHSDQIWGRVVCIVAPVYVARLRGISSYVELAVRRLSNAARREFYARYNDGL